jgi:hypothetical protein
MVAALATAILLGYLGALWWLLREESGYAWSVLALVVAIAMALRLLWPSDYPPGYNPDEPKTLANAVGALAEGRLFGLTDNGAPVFLWTLFAAPLVGWVGANQWAMRAYPIALGTLAPLLGFAVARGMRLSVEAALVAAALIAAMPWALFYGRQCYGGELIFHELLALAGLSRLVWNARAGLVDAMLVTLGLTLLLYDYWAGLPLVAMPLVAAALTQDWRRGGYCLGALLLTLALSRSAFTYGYLTIVPGALRAWTTGATPVGDLYRAQPMIHPAISTFDGAVERSLLGLRILASPVAEHTIFAAPAAAVHPLVVLVAAAAGLLFTSARRKLFLLPVFLGGMALAVMTNQFSVSAHRALMALPAVSLFAACGVDAIRCRRLRLAVAVALGVAATALGPRYFFSTTFWTPEVHRACCPFPY